MTVIRKTRKLQTRAPAELYNALLALAEIERRTPSEMLREVVRNACAEKGLWPPAATTEPQTAQGKED